MHKHLALVKTLQTGQEAYNGQFPDIEIILTQAILMEAGSATFKAFKSAEMADFLAGLVSLAYTSLQVFALHNQEIIENTGAGYQIYQKLAIMQLLSEKIHQCSSGEAAHYAELYYCCANLASGYLNANFDKAFQAYHEWRKTYLNSATGLVKPQLPELTDCLYE
jgi:hypothetical protein